jgi:hypothetical protein
MLVLNPCQVPSPPFSMLLPAHMTLVELLLPLQLCVHEAAAARCWCWLALSGEVAGLSPHAALGMLQCTLNLQLLLCTRICFM